MISGRVHYFRVSYEEKNASQHIKKPRNPIDDFLLQLC